MEWKDAKRQLVRSNWKLRVLYYGDVFHQLKRLWWKLTAKKGQK